MSGYLSVKALAVYSGLSVRTLRAYLVHPSTPLPHYRVGGRVLIGQTEFDSWMRQFKVNEVSDVHAGSLSASTFDELVVDPGAQPLSHKRQTDEMDRLVAAAVRGIRRGGQL